MWLESMREPKPLRLVKPETATCVSCSEERRLVQMTPQLRKPPEEKPVDTLFSSDSDTVLILDKEKTEPGGASSPQSHHRLKVGQAVRIPPAPPAPPSRQRTPSRERDTSGTGVEEGTNHWTRKNRVPRRVRGERAREISKGLTQILRRTAPRLNIAIRAPRFWNEWVTEEEIIDVIHYNHKSRFEVRPEDGTYSMRALQGHSISHVRDDLILTKLSVADTPAYAAHGTFYDFYESIARHGLMAGGLQGKGQSFRRHVHLVQELPWEGAIQECAVTATWPPGSRRVRRQQRDSLSTSPRTLSS